VNRHYLHHDYARETKEAWDLLGEYLGIAMRGEDTEEYVLSITSSSRISNQTALSESSNSY